MTTNTDTFETIIHQPAGGDRMPAPIPKDSPYANLDEAALRDLNSLLMDPNTPLRKLRDIRVGIGGAPPETYEQELTPEVDPGGYVDPAIYGILPTEKTLQLHGPRTHAEQRGFVRAVRDANGAVGERLYVDKSRKPRQP